MVRLVLDTGVFFVPEALDQLRGMNADVVVPAVVYMERGRQLGARGVTRAAWNRTIRSHGFQVESFGPEEAARFAMHVDDSPRWRRHYRDAMIAGHVHRDDVLWTTNPKDFLAVGLEADQVIGVPWS